MKINFTYSILIGWIKKSAYFVSLIILYFKVIKKGKQISKDNIDKKVYFAIQTNYDMLIYIQ